MRAPTFGYYRDQKTLKLTRMMRVVETNKGEVLTHQLPNRYRTWCPGGRRGILPKVARILTVGDQSFMKGEANSTTDRRRRYYQGFRSFLMAALRGKVTEGFYPSRASDHKYILGAI